MSRRKRLLISPVDEFWWGGMKYKEHLGNKSRCDRIELALGGAWHAKFEKVTKVIIHHQVDGSVRESGLHRSADRTSFDTKRAHLGQGGLFDNGQMI